MTSTERLRGLAFVSVDPSTRYQHAAGDPKRATRYRVETREPRRPIGFVESFSEPNMVKPAGLRYYTRQRGWSRAWIARTFDGRRVGHLHYTRSAAALALLDDVNSVD